MTRPLTAAEIYSGIRMDATDDGGTPPADGGTPPQGTEPPADDQTPTETAEEKAARLEAALEESKKHSRTWEQRAKDNKDAAKKLADIEAANATPDQKLTLAEKRAADAETELARYKVAHETSLPASLLSLLNGDEDSMREQAKALLAFKGETPPPARRTPAPDPSQGGTGGAQKVSAADEGRAEAQRRIAARNSRKTS